MSNNTVNIRGFLIHHKIGFTDGVPNVDGWIYTGSALLGGRHPFIVNGRPAEIIAAYIREHGLTSLDTPPDFPGQATGVVVRGKLASYPKISYLDIRSAHFFQASLRAEKFILNDLTLGGQLVVKDRNLRKEKMGSLEIPALDVLIATDTPYNGGLHPVLLLNKHAEEVYARFRQTDFQPFGATVGGRLVTTKNRCLIQASFVCPDETGKETK